MTPEFSRVERLDAIGGEPRAVSIVADADERAALSCRFGLVVIHTLTADFHISRTAVGIKATGRVVAAVVQACSITGDPLPAVVDEPVELLFVEPGESDAAEVELDAVALDTVEIEGGGVDLGEAAAETLALSLDPFPRGPGAAEALADAGVLSEEQAGPFGALAGMRDKLAGN